MDLLDLSSACRMTVKNTKRLERRQQPQHHGTHGKADEDSKYHNMHASIYDQGLTWEFIPWLRKVTKLPILLKGILAPADAYKAVHQ